MIDGDLQDPPEMISKLYQQLLDGYDVAYAVRTKRKEKVHKKISYWLFYRFLGFLTKNSIPLDSGDFSIMKRKVLVGMLSIPEQSPVFAGYALLGWV